MHVPRCMFDYSLTLLMEVPLLSPDQEIASGYKVRPASIHDIPALATCRQTDDPTVGAKLFKTRFDQDAQCYLVLDSDNHSTCAVGGNRNIQSIRVMYFSA